jgi:hypothetical protein
MSFQVIQENEELHTKTEKEMRHQAVQRRSLQVGWYFTI